MSTNRKGMTLVEVMIALLILGSGLSAIASLFPIAGTLQRRTYDSVVVRQVSDSVTDLVDARGFNAPDLITTEPGQLGKMLTNQVYACPSSVLNSNDPTPSLTKWGLVDRAYPTAMGNDPEVDDRSYYWVPLVRRANTVDWHVYIFVLKKEPGADYGNHIGSANPSDPNSVPRVVSQLVATTEVINESDPKGKGKGLISDLGWGNNDDEIDAILDTQGFGTESSIVVLQLTNPFQVGDLVLDSQGVVHRVLETYGLAIRVDGYVSPLVTELWYAPRAPGVSESPTRKILSFGTGVVLK